MVELEISVLRTLHGKWIFLHRPEWHQSSIRTICHLWHHRPYRSEPLDLSRANYHGEVRGSSWSYLVPYTVVFLSGRCCWIDGDRSMDYCHYHLPAPPCHSISHLSFFWFFFYYVCSNLSALRRAGETLKDTLEKSHFDFWYHPQTSRSF